MPKIYVIILFPELKKAVTLDRGYRLIDGDWEKVKMGDLKNEDELNDNEVLGEDIIEKDQHFFSGDLPEWALEADDTGFRHVAFWTNYYE